jgi:hypothetical protein
VPLKEVLLREASKLRSLLFAACRMQKTQAPPCQACSKPYQNRHFLNARKLARANAFDHERQMQAAEIAFRGL